MSSFLALPLSGEERDLWDAYQVVFRAYYDDGTATRAELIAAYDAYVFVARHRLVIY